MKKTETNRIGEIGKNNFGSIMKIVRYGSFMDIDVLFEEYNWICKTSYNLFKKGEIRCPYERTVSKYGFHGEGQYKSRENNRVTKEYNAWKSMLSRCYVEKTQNKHPSYTECTVCEEWHNFQNFAQWYINNYYEVEGEKMALDKDILIKGNKIYSPDTCIFVPQLINSLFIKCNKARGLYPVGVQYLKNENLFKASCCNGNNDQVYLGHFKTKEDAFNAYKQRKEQIIKSIADLYKDKIPQKLYEAMYNYIVEITD